MIQTDVLEVCQLAFQEQLRIHALVFAITLILAVVVQFESNLLRDKIWRH
jgi:hypothetical protein